MVNDQINWLTISAPASCDKGSVSGLLVAILFVMILDMPQASPVQHSEAQRISAQHSRAPAWAPSWAPARVPARVPARALAAARLSGVRVFQLTTGQPDSQTAIEKLSNVASTNQDAIHRARPLSKTLGGLCVCNLLPPFSFLGGILIAFFYAPWQSSSQPSGKREQQLQRSTIQPSCPRVESSSWQPES